jgi:hypothetical protein
MKESVRLLLAHGLMRQWKNRDEILFRTIEKQKVVEDGSVGKTQECCL